MPAWKSLSRSAALLVLLASSAVMEDAEHSRTDEVGGLCSGGGGGVCGGADDTAMLQQRTEEGRLATGPAGMARRPSAAWEPWAVGTSALHELSAGPARDLTALPFSLPFDAGAYTGAINATSTTADGVTTAAVAFYRIDAERVHLGLAANAGWVGFGMNRWGPGMRRADIVVCRVYASGNVTAVDYHAPENAAPSLDAVQDWITVRGGYEAVASGASGRPVTWCEISRSRKTCEAANDLQLADADMPLFGLLAWSRWASVRDQLHYHGPSQRRSVPFSFAGVQAGDEAWAIPPGARSLTVEAPTVRVGSTAESSVCSLHRLPVDASKKYHVIGYRLVYDTRSPSYVGGLQHHVDVKQCARQVHGVKDGQLFGCSRAMFSCAQAMSNGLSVYLPRGEMLPTDVGIGIGNGSTEWVVVQRHFYNPSGKFGVSDAGTRFEVAYTGALRPYEYRVLTLSTKEITVPPRTYGHVTRSYCTPSCTRRLESESVVRSVTFHMHIHARSAVLRLVRAGRELEPLSAADPWDPAQAQRLVDDRALQPGDLLILECRHNNDLAVNLTYGDGLEQEMCMASVELSGAGSLTTCQDMPLGITDRSPPSWCYDGSGNLRPDRVCEYTLPRTFCPSEEFPPGSEGATVFNGFERGMAFKEYVPPKDVLCQGPAEQVFLAAVPGRCPAAPGGPLAQRAATGPTVPSSARTDETNASFMAAADADPSVLVGEKRCGLDAHDFKVSWAADCAARRVTFEVEALRADGGWLALGLLDAGNATHVRPMPSTRMKGADIVQLSLATGSLRDSVGEGYAVPRAKSAPVARFESAQRANGKTVAKFSRPFDSPDGVTLVEDGFLYLLCSVRESSPFFGAKHTAAHASALRFSLFGGLPGSGPAGTDGGVLAPTPSRATAPASGECQLCVPPLALSTSRYAGIFCLAGQLWLNSWMATLSCAEGRARWSSRCCEAVAR